MNLLNKRYIFLFLALSSALAIGLWGLSVGTAHANDDSNDAGSLPQAQADTAPLCRFGLNVNDNTAAYDLAPLRLGWYINYSAFPSSSQPGNMEHAPMIRLDQTDATTYQYRPNGQQLQNAIAQNPGAVWFIGNEPDRVIYQDDIEPAVYARAYHDLYALIKSQDPTAKIAAGSIVQPTELRLIYLDMVLDAYRDLYGTAMPVDVWSVHNFILNEASDDFCPYDCWGAGIPPGVDANEGLRITVQQTDDFELFVAQIERFRQWMAQNGYRDVPLYLSEYGVLMPENFGFSADRVNTFMQKTFDYLRDKRDPVYGNPNDGNRLVQRFSWYSLSDSVNFNGHLFDPDTYQRSAMGDYFASYVAPIQEEADFYPVQFHTALAPFSPAEDPLTVTMHTKIANSGNTLASSPLVVHFYAGDPNDGGELIGTDEVSLAGCGDTQWASTVWTDAPAGLHELYVVVEPKEGAAPESTDAQGNNTVTRTVVLTADNWTALPVISR